MPFSDEQFTKLWESMIRIEENTKNNYRQLTEHIAEDIGKFAVGSEAVKAVHTRLDKMKTDLEVEKHSVRVEWDRAIGFQNKMMGAIAMMVFFVPLAIAFFKK